MLRKLAEYRTVWQECRRTYKTTGTVMPSSRVLSRALTRFVRQGPGQDTAGEAPSNGVRTNANSPSGRRILEVGPGTGPVTHWIIDALRPEDELDLAELNDTFVEVLRRRLAEEPHFQSVGQRCRILHEPVQNLVDREAPYDLIISGLPLNNFEVHEVEHVLEVFRRLLAPGGTLSFFEYVAIRKAKATISNRIVRQRLRGVAAAIDALRAEGEFRRDMVLTNVPPAWVHHVRLG